jgi:hypothetical protein
MGAAGHLEVRLEAVNVSMARTLTSANMPRMHACNCACSVWVHEVAGSNPASPTRDLIGGAARDSRRPPQVNPEPPGGGFRGVVPPG